MGFSLPLTPNDRLPFAATVYPPAAGATDIRPSLLCCRGGSRSAAHQLVARRQCNCDDRGTSRELSIHTAPLGPFLAEKADICISLRSILVQAFYLQLFGLVLT